RNDHYELGNSTVTATKQTTPVSVQGLTGPVMTVAGGQFHALALLTNGTLMAWGDNRYGQIGNNTSSGSVFAKQATACAQPSGATSTVRYRAIAAGIWHNLAIAATGFTYAWGGNMYGAAAGATASTPLLVPTKVPGLATVRAIAAGGFRSMAL